MHMFVCLFAAKKEKEENPSVVILSKDIEFMLFSKGFTYADMANFRNALGEMQRINTVRERKDFIEKVDVGSTPQSRNAARIVLRDLLEQHGTKNPGVYEMNFGINFTERQMQHMKKLGLDEHDIFTLRKELWLYKKGSEIQGKGYEPDFSDNDKKHASLLALYSVYTDHFGTKEPKAGKYHLTKEMYKEFKKEEAKLVALYKNEEEEEEKKRKLAAKPTIVDKPTSTISFQTNDGTRYELSVPRRLTDRQLNEAVTGLQDGYSLEVVIMGLGSSARGAMLSSDNTGYLFTFGDPKTRATARNVLSLLSDNIDTESVLASADAVSEEEKRKKPGQYYARNNEELKKNPGRYYTPAETAEERKDRLKQLAEEYKKRGRVKEEAEEEKYAQR